MPVVIISYKNIDLPGKPEVNELDIVAIDEDGIQYVIYFGATKKIFDDFLPVVGEMVTSFSVTGNIYHLEKNPLKEQMIL